MACSCSLPSSSPKASGPSGRGAPVSHARARASSPAMAARDRGTLPPERAVALAEQDAGGGEPVGRVLVGVPSSSAKASGGEAGSDPPDGEEAAQERGGLGPGHGAVRVEATVGDAPTDLPPGQAAHGGLVDVAVVVGEAAVGHLARRARHGDGGAGGGAEPIVVAATVAVTHATPSTIRAVRVVRTPIRRAYDGRGSVTVALRPGTATQSGDTLRPVLDVVERTSRWAYGASRVPAAHGHGRWRRVGGPDDHLGDVDSGRRGQQPTRLHVDVVELHVDVDPQHDDDVGRQHDDDAGRQHDDDGRRRRHHVDDRPARPS